MRDSEALRRQIRENAREIARLHARVHETFAQRATHGRQPWEDACREIHARYERLALPGGYDDAMLRRLASGERNAVETVLCFLEVRPYFFRSGYMWKDLLRKAKRAPMNSQHAARLAAIVQGYAAYRARLRAACA